MQLQRGLQFAPGYRLQEFLGRGQFGQVWRATAPGGTAAAVKFIDLSDGQGEKEYEGIRRVKQIRHANLMPIIAIWLLDGEGRMIEEAPDEAVETINLTAGNVSDHSREIVTPQKDASWLVVAMLLGGQSLQQRLRACITEGKRGIPTKELISYIDESAKGLDYLNSSIHDLGDGLISIQHCDVKPANIVLIGTSAVVCDFGLARILSRAQASATNASGTPAYMAPEAIEGKPSKSSDQYSLAVTYYQLRTGSLPVNESSLWQVLDSHRRGKLDFSLVSAAEQAVLRKATHLDWKQRFESNVDMVEALRDSIRSSEYSQQGVMSSATPWTDPHDQSRLTAPFAGTQGESLAEHDPQATIGSEFLKLQSSAVSNPEALFGFADTHRTSDNIATSTLASTEESTKEIGAPAQKSDARQATIAESVATLSAELWSQARKRPQAALTGVGTAAVLALMGIWFGPGNNGTSNNSLGEVVVPRTDETREPITPQDPQVLVEQARQSLILGNNELAVSTFSQAVQLEPTLVNTTPVVFSGHEGSVTQLRVSQNGEFLVSLAQDNFPILWRLASFDGKTQPPSNQLVGHDDLIEEPAFSLSLDGSRLVTGGYGAQAFVWNLNNQGEATKLSLDGHDDDITATAWHPNGEVVVTVSADQHLGIWQLADGTLEHQAGVIAKQRIFATKKMYQSVQFDPSGRYLVCTSINQDTNASQGPGIYGELDSFKWDDVQKTLEVESAPQPMPVMASGNFARRVTLSSFGQVPIAIVADDKVVSLWSLDEPQKLIDRTEQLSALPESQAVIANETRQLIATGLDDGSVHLWWRGNSVQSRSSSICTASIYGVGLTQDQHWLATASLDGTVSLVNLTEPEAKPLVLSDSKVSAYSVAIDPDGRWLFVGTADGTIQAWDLIHAKLLCLMSRPNALTRPRDNSQTPYTDSRAVISNAVAHNKQN